MGLRWATVVQNTSEVIQVQASIEGGDEEGCGLEVIDNNGIEHWIEVKYENGEISYHESGGYPDEPTKRTPEGNEHVEQARRFAQYYVYLERGYDTVPSQTHPERINAARVAITSLSESEFDQFFGDFYQQLRSYDHPSVDPIVDIPSAASSADSVLYRTNIYLGLNPLETELREEAEEIANRDGLGLAADSIEEKTANETSNEEIDSWRAFSKDLGTLAVEDDIDLSDGLYIDSVSSLHMAYIDDQGEEHITGASEPFERDPDAIIELPVMDAGTLEEFQDYINHNLACQIRDCFVRMGLEPPKPFQILGYGDFESAEQYKRLDMYPNYIDSEEEKAFA